ncbi:MBL fold metallo-hydrolase [Gramella sp. GC03-9]|uniref:MBL fold metallo-hydrolase n=1 Tax=Christiangramia oceanisediminis TaxID=2920386 RepID=A0A9X2KZD7_9FLAO|nr:MBL fold metallo-hydrolase [Gramella oceanisediminis]MCP9201178.1 MBL fold metallo-hydrolase [Gramella oceanisediminis]
MKRHFSFLSLLLFCLPPIYAFQNFDDVQIEITPVNKNVYMLTGAGGNIGILTGDDGIFMIDDQFAPLSEKIIQKLKTISEQPVTYLVNTHHHGDHTGGNENFKEQGALIFAHENVRKRIKDNKEISGTGMLPVITFNEEVNLHLNENDIMVVHVHNAHTDGDALIYFPQSNVLHTGDTFFNGRFPYIDLNSGGSVDGDIEAARTGLSIINENTRIIPGHGSVASYEDYKNYLKMMEGIRSNIQNAMRMGKSKEEIISDSSLTSEFYTDEEMKDTFITGPRIRETFYESLK